jgi:hypothetical protein
MLHLSINKIKIVHHSEQSDEVMYKPNGLWYSPRDVWIKYFSKQINKKEHYKYTYKMKLRYTKYGDRDRHRVLKITDEKTFDRFTLRYGSILKNKYIDDQYFVLIDWAKVAKKYGGIELIPLINSRIRTADRHTIKKYNKKFKFTSIDDNNSITLDFWQSTFDVPSGCVWNPHAIKKMKRI